MEQKITVPVQDLKMNYVTELVKITYDHHILVVCVRFMLNLFFLFAKIVYMSLLTFLLNFMLINILELYL